MTNTEKLQRELEQLQIAVDAKALELVQAIAAEALAGKKG